jgi:hypothetical protein
VRPVTAAEIAPSMINMTEAELDAMTLPGLHETLWDDREFLGWRDATTHEGIPRLLGGRLPPRFYGPLGRKPDACGKKCDLCPLPHRTTCPSGQPVCRPESRRGGQAGQHGGDVSVC